MNSLIQALSIPLNLSGSGVNFGFYHRANLTFLPNLEISFARGAGDIKNYAVKFHSCFNSRFADSSKQIEQNQIFKHTGKNLYRCRPRRAASRADIFYLFWLG